MRRKVLWVSLIVLGLCFCFSGTISAAPGDSIWTVSKNDPLSLQPAVGKDGLIYVQGGSTESTSRVSLYALNTDGSVKWENDFALKPKGLITSELGFVPSVGPSGKIYNLGFREDAATLSGSVNLFAFSKDGTIQWKKELGAALNQSVSTDGTIYTAGRKYDSGTVTDTTSLYAIHSDGTVKWTQNFRAYPPLRAPIISSDGSTVIIAFQNLERSKYRVIALSATGSIKWSRSFSSTIAPLALGSNKILFVGVSNRSGGSSLAALSLQDGSTLWQRKEQGGGGGGLVLLENSVLVNSGIGTFAELSMDSGTKITDFSINPSSMTQDDLKTLRGMTHGNDGKLYLSFGSGHLVALTSDRTVSWIKELTPDPLNVRPPKIHNGILYQSMTRVSDDKDQLFAVEASSKGLAAEGWPTLGHDNQNTFQAGPGGQSCSLEPKNKLFPPIISPQFGHSYLFLTDFEESENEPSDIDPSSVNLAEAEPEKWHTNPHFLWLKYDNTDLEIGEISDGWFFFDQAELSIEGDLKDAGCFETSEEVLVWP